MAAHGRICITKLTGTCGERWSWIATKGPHTVANGPKNGYRTKKRAIEAACEFGPQMAPLDWTDVEHWGKGGIEYVRRVRAF